MFIGWTIADMRYRAPDVLNIYCPTLHGMRFGRVSDTDNTNIHIDTICLVGAVCVVSHVPGFALNMTKLNSLFSPAGIQRFIISKLFVALSPQQVRDFIRTCQISAPSKTSNIENRISIKHFKRRLECLMPDRFSKLKVLQGTEKELNRFRVQILIPKKH